MREQQHIFERIEDYLHGRMTEEDRLAFEKQMREDEHLASLVKKEKEINEAIHLASLADIKSTVATDLKKIKYNSGTDWSGLRKIFIAGFVLLVSGVSAYLFFKEKNKSLEKSGTTSIVQNNSVEQTVDEEKSDSIIDIRNIYSEESKKKMIDEPTKKQIEITQYIDEQEEFKADTIFHLMPKGSNTRGNESPLSMSEKNTNDTNSVRKHSPIVKLECNKKFEIKIEPACHDIRSGKITVATDGSGDFDFHLDGLNFSGTRAEFTNLPSGDHTIVINYNDGCSYSKLITIKEKWCPLNKPYSFNPDYNEKWEIKYSAGGEGMFFIFDKLGKEVYKNKFGAGEEIWNGSDNQGNIVPMGTYIAIIEYSDGRKEKVDLTIVR